jgi:hypothetical protein
MYHRRGHLSMPFGYGRWPFGRGFPFGAACGRTRTMENAVEKAIRLLGPTLFQASVRTGIQPSTLWKWAKAGRIKDGLRAVELSRATDGAVSVEELVGATSENGDEPPKGKGFLKGRYRLPATYQASSASLPVVPRFPDTAARAA